MRTHHVDNGQRNPQPFKSLLPNTTGGVLVGSYKTLQRRGTRREKKDSLMIDHPHVLQRQGFSGA